MWHTLTHTLWHFVARPWKPEADEQDKGVIKITSRTSIIPKSQRRQLNSVASRLVPLGLTEDMSRIISKTRYRSWCDRSCKRIYECFISKIQALPTLERINKSRYHMMKTLIFEVTLLWHVRKYQHDLHPVKCQHKNGIGGDLCPQRDSSHQQHPTPPPPPHKKTIFMLVFSRWPSHTFSSPLPRDALAFKIRTAKVIFVCKMWLRVDAEMGKTSVRQHAHTHTHTKMKIVYTG